MTTSTGVKDRNVPVVDFQQCGLSTNDCSDAALKEAGKQIVQVYQTVGFLYLKNHGLANDLIEKIFSVSDAFFNLPDGTKEKYTRPLDTLHGWQKTGRESLNPAFRPPDLKEAFNHHPKSSVKTWPNAELPEFKTTYDEFFSQCAKLTSRVLQAIAHGLEINPHILVKSVEKMGLGDNATTLQAIQYVPLDPDVEMLPNQIRLGEHTDFGAITLLLQDDVGGLQVQHDGHYIDVPPVPGTIVVNLGALMQRWTGDQLIAAPHRVVFPKEQKTRRCVAFFSHPDDDVIITCLDGSQKYEPIRALDYLLKRYEEVFLDFKKGKDYIEN